MISLDEAKSKQGHFKIVFDCLNELISISKSVLNEKKKANKKQESDLLKYQYRENTIKRTNLINREHPIDTVVLNTYNNKNDESLENVKIVYGVDSNEYTRSHHALAIAIANTIYFRNGAYKPESEEGRKLIAHELTHVAQNKNKPLADNRTKEELEKEAEAKELNEKYNPDPIITKIIYGKKYTLKQSVWKKISSVALFELENDIQLSENSMSETDYLELLLKYNKWEQEKKSSWLK